MLKHHDMCHEGCSGVTVSDIQELKTCAKETLNFGIKVQVGLLLLLESSLLIFFFFAKCNGVTNGKALLYYLWVKLLKP